MRLCSAPGCDRKHYCRGYCVMHYGRLRSHGHVGLLTPEDFFWSKVDKRGESECWMWTGAKSADGYGNAWYDRRSMAAHRASHLINIGAIPDGYEVDHLCYQPSCVNPAHLEAVTPDENRRRKYARRTRCKRGHEWTTANTYRNPTDGSRVCRLCVADNQRRYQARKRAATGGAA